jgi:hypothetical protein
MRMVPSCRLRRCRVLLVLARALDLLRALGALAAPAVTWVAEYPALNAVVPPFALWGVAVSALPVDLAWARLRERSAVRPPPLAASGRSVTRADGDDAGSGSVVVAETRERRGAWSRASWPTIGTPPRAPGRH